MLRILFNTKKSFIAHPWCLLSVVGLEEYSVHDWQAATSVQRAPVTWQEWGLWARLCIDIFLYIEEIDSIYTCKPDFHNQLDCLK